MSNLGKRISIGAILGLIFGLICFGGFVSSPNMPAEMVVLQEWSRSNPMMWTIVINRFVLGLVVAIAGFITINPFFKFKVPVILRGAKFGALISLTMAPGTFMGSNPDEAWMGFWVIIIAGAIMGAIIDLIITKVAGQGEDLIIKK